MIVYGEDYFGFVYIWRDRKHNRYYVGSHLGSIDDGYVCSSRWMNKAYKRRPQDFKRRILKYWSEKNRKNLLLEERRWLDMIQDHELGNRYYNKKRITHGKEIEEIRKDNKKSWTPERKAAWATKMKKWREDNPEAAYKAAAQFIGKKHPPETLAKIGAGNKGKVMSDDARTKMSLSAKARNQGEKNRILHQEKKIGMYGKKHTEEAKRKISVGQFNKRWPSNT